MRQGDVHARDQSSDNVQSVTKYVHDGDVMDKILSHVGDMGLYQKLLFVVMILFGYFYGFVYFVQMFITVTPDNHWCKVPELSGLSMELRRNLSAPGAASGEWDHCRTFDANWSEVLATLSPPADDTPLVACQHGWEFELSDIPYETVASERGWVCDRASNVPTAQSIFFAGAVFGVLIFGWVADRFGRVPAIMVTNVVGAIGGVGTIFTTTVWDFIVCRFLVGMSFNNCFMIVYVLVLEYVGLKYRTMVASLSIAFSFTVAASILPWMAYYIADWRIFTWATSTPMFIALLAPWVLPESVKWLVSRGRIDEAVAILRRFEVINRTKIPDDVMYEFMIFCEKAKLEEKQSILEMFKSVPLRWTTLFLILSFTTNEMVFDGLTRLSDSFDLSFFAVVSLYGVFELFSCLSVVVVLDRFGRRMSTSMSSYACGFILLIALFVPDGIPRVALAVVARFFIAIGYTAIIQWSTEIIPTPFRATGLSILQMISFAMNMIIPFIVYSQHLWSLLPIVIFTVLSVFAASMSLLLPETNGLPLPQTRADGEKIVKEHSLRWKRKGTEAKPSTINASK